MDFIENLWDSPIKAGQEENPSNERVLEIPQRGKWYTQATESDRNLNLVSQPTSKPRLDPHKGLLINE